MAIEWTTVEKIDRTTGHTMQVLDKRPTDVGTERVARREATREDLLAACEAVGLRVAHAEPVRDGTIDLCAKMLADALGEHTDARGFVDKCAEVARVIAELRADQETARSCSVVEEALADVVRRGTRDEDLLRSVLDVAGAYLSSSQRVEFRRLAEGIRSRLDGATK